MTTQPSTQAPADGLPPLPTSYEVTSKLGNSYGFTADYSIRRGDRVVTVEQAQAYAAALRAQVAQPVPDGWKLVPVEPTAEMMAAGSKVFYADSRCTQADVYREMLASAPPAPLQAEPAKCPNCGQPAPLLFSRALEGDELETVHCGCLHGQPEEAPPAQPAPVVGDEREAFAIWKAYPLPELNSDGHYDKDWLHREWVAFRAGRASLQPARSGQAGGDAGGAPRLGPWAVFDSQGFCQLERSEVEARAFCDTYNARNPDDPLRPYTCCAMDDIRPPQPAAVPASQVAAVNRYCRAGMCVATDAGHEDGCAALTTSKGQS